MSGLTIPVELAWQIAASEAAIKSGSTISEALRFSG